ncbi:coiled-coil domain-containing protein 85 [Megachile rotundata]|uniref:coiled-coil domain-containing protein 85 n=1 Tax=Megachile rotundata TaxID=143995 RepID=UPI003FD694AD
MSNKSKSQPQQQQQQQQQQQHPSHVIKTTVDQVPPRYQPPPQPTSGILKNHPHFVANPAVPTSVSTSVQGPTATLNHHQSTQQRPVSQQKDAQSKYSPRIEHRHHPQGGNTLIAPVTKTQPHSYLQAKVGQGQYLPPNGQYPTVNSTQTPPIRQRISDDEFLRLGPVEMLKFVRKTESDIARLAAEQNRQIQSLLSELRALKEANQRLSDDNQELRDLCCFLDDDRQKGRKLAREWQRFGRYTASVMRQEVSAYQNKLRQLDNKQQELIKDNLELKELCLYLDEERGGGQRDDGDGSSSSTNAEETAPPRPRHISTFNDQTMQYVRSLEQRVKQLEEDKSVLQARAQGWEVQPGEIWGNQNSPSENPHIGGRPEAVVRALQVLEVREQLEREEGGHDGEKALVREMCNVVWRKLEEGPQTRH